GVTELSSTDQTLRYGQPVASLLSLSPGHQEGRWSRMKSDGAVNAIWYLGPLFLGTFGNCARDSRAIGRGSSGDAGDDTDLGRGDNPRRRAQERGRDRR